MQVMEGESREMDREKRKKTDMLPYCVQKQTFSWIFVLGIGGTGGKRLGNWNIPERSLQNMFTNE